MLSKKNIFPVLFMLSVLAVFNSCQKDYRSPSDTGAITKVPDSVYVYSIRMYNFPETNDVTGLPYDSAFSVDTASTDTIYADPFIGIEDAGNLLNPFLQSSHFNDVKFNDAIVYYLTTPYLCPGFGKQIRISVSDYDSTVFPATSDPIIYSEFIDSLTITLPVPTITDPHPSFLLPFISSKGIRIEVGLQYK